MICCDILNRITNISFDNGASTISYTYDSRGNRLTKNEDGSIDQYTYGGASSALSNYASLYSKNSPWAQKASKAAYANAVVGG